MFRALGAALTLALIILVLRLALPEVANPLIEIIVKIIHLIDTIIDDLSGLA